jgi:gluconolactonase
MIQVIALVVLIGACACCLALSVQHTEPHALVHAGAKLQKLAADMKFTEGPVWIPRDGGYLVFSDIPADELKRWSMDESLRTFRKPSHQANGNTLDREGRLVTCEHHARRVTRTEPDGHVTVLVDSFEGKRFNSPNDVVVRSDGTIWFTDPPYGLPAGAARELDRNYVFRFEPASKRIGIVAEDFDMPNGLCFSPDERTLYVADSGKPHHIRAFDVTGDGRLEHGRVFCTIDAGVPDGIRCDEHGNVWSSAGDGVHVFAPDGRLLGKIPVPETPANLCFGGADGRTLFITARTSLYSIRVDPRGALSASPVARPSGS